MASRIKSNIDRKHKKILTQEYGMDIKPLKNSVDIDWDNNFTFDNVRRKILSFRGVRALKIKRDTRCIRYVFTILSDRGLKKSCRKTLINQIDGIKPITTCIIWKFRKVG